MKHIVRHLPTIWGLGLWRFSTKPSLLINLNENLNVTETITALGGTIAIGKVLFSGEIRNIIENINEKEIYFGEKIKFDYSMLNFSDELSADKICSEIKNKFKKENLKARHKKIKKAIKIQNSDFSLGTPSELERTELLYFLFKEREYFFGLIQAVHKSKMIEKRDMKKPVRREALAISPRLAKILINLSQAKESLVDPFCGIGVILQEALLQNINVIGIDVDRKATGSANQNLNWLTKEYGIKAKYKILNDDSRRVVFEKVEGVATEPFLSELLKKIPSEEKASSIIKRFENLMIAILNNIKKYVKKNGKIAFTAPLIKTSNKMISCSINNICQKTHLKLHSLDGVNFPVREYKKDQIIGREIYVLVASP